MEICLAATTGVRITALLHHKDMEFCIYAAAARTPGRTSLPGVHELGVEVAFAMRRRLQAVPLVVVLAQHVAGAHCQARILLQAQSTW